MSYGKKSNNTINILVWVIAGLSVFMNLRFINRVGFDVILKSKSELETKDTTSIDSIKPIIYNDSLVMDRLDSIYNKIKIMEIKNDLYKSIKNDTSFEIEKATEK